MWWEELSDDELRARLDQSGVWNETVDHLVTTREDDASRLAIAELLGPR